MRFRRTPHLGTSCLYIISEACCQVHITQLSCTAHYSAVAVGDSICTFVQCTALGAYITVLYKLPGSVRSAHWLGDTVCYKMSLYKSRQQQHGVWGAQLHNTRLLLGNSTPT